MKSVSPLTRALIVLLMCVARSGFAEMPPGLMDALTSHGWAFPYAKAPVLFRPDGIMMDADGTARFEWKLDEATGTLHLLEKGPKSKDKARIDVWFWSDLTGFSWYDNHGQVGGQGTRVDATTAAKTTASAPLPTKLPPLPLPTGPVDEHAYRILQADAVSITVSFSKTGRGGAEHATYYINDATVVTIDGHPTHSRELKGGMVAHLAVAPDQRTVTRIEARDAPRIPEKGHRG